MDSKRMNEELENASFDSEEGLNDTTNLQQEQSDSADESNDSDNVTDKKDSLEAKYKELNDSYLRLMAEFDNYRKRTLREKADLIKSGGESVLVNLLPVVDDLERAMETIRSADNVEAVAQGVELIYNKFHNYLNQQGVKPIEAVGQPFDTELFEAIAIVPAPDPAVKGKVIDSMQTGYLLHDKVIRHAKVVVAE